MDSACELQTSSFDAVLGARRGDLHCAAHRADVQAAADALERPNRSYTQALRLLQAHGARGSDMERLDARVRRLLAGASDASALSLVALHGGHHAAFEPSVQRISRRICEHFAQQFAAPSAPPYSGVRAPRQPTLLVLDALDARESLPCSPAVVQALHDAIHAFAGHERYVSAASALGHTLGEPFKRTLIAALIAALKARPDDALLGVLCPDEHQREALHRAWAPNSAVALPRVCDLLSEQLLSTTFEDSLGDCDVTGTSGTEIGVHLYELAAERHGRSLADALWAPYTVALLRTR